MSGAQGGADKNPIGAPLLLRKCRERQSAQSRQFLRAWLTCFSAASLCSVVIAGPSPAQQQTNQQQNPFQGMMSDLEQLEQQHQRPGDPSAPLVTRLQSLEQHLLGAPRQGSMVERIQYLRAAPANRVMPGNFPGNSGWSGASGSGSNMSKAGGTPALPGSVPYTPGTVSSAPETLNSAPGTVNSGPGTLPSASSGLPLSPGTRTSASGPGWTPANSQSRPQPPADVANASPAAANQFPPVPAPQRPLVAPQSDSSNFNPAVAAHNASINKKFGSDALPLLNAFPPTIVRMEPDNATLIARPDYYEQVRKASKGKCIRFKSMPIPVYIQNFPDRGFMNCVLRAFENWEGRSDGTVRFSQTDNPNQARIQVLWKHLGSKSDASGCLLGAHTILKYTSHGNGNLSLMSVGAVPVPIYIPRLGPKYSVPPQVMEVNLDLVMTKEPSIRYQCLQNIVTHELGHALGLLGHSPNEADMMYPITDEHSRLSQRDLNTINVLYKNKLDIPL